MKNSLESHSLQIQIRLPGLNHKPLKNPFQSHPQNIQSLQIQSLFLIQVHYPSKSLFKVQIKIQLTREPKHSNQRRRTQYVRRCRYHKLETPKVCHCLIKCHGDLAYPMSTLEGRSTYGLLFAYIDLQPGTGQLMQIPPDQLFLLLKQGISPKAQ